MGTGSSSCRNIFAKKEATPAAPLSKAATPPPESPPEPPLEPTFDDHIRWNYAEMKYTLWNDANSFNPKFIGSLRKLAGGFVATLIFMTAVVENRALIRDVIGLPATKENVVLYQEGEKIAKSAENVQDEGGNIPGSREDQDN